MVSCSAAEDGVEDTARRAELLVDYASKRGEERGKTASHCHVLHVGMCTCIDSGRFYPRRVLLRCCVPSRAPLCRAATCTLRPLRPTRTVPFGSGCHWLLLPNGCANQSLLRKFCLKLVVPFVGTRGDTRGTGCSQRVVARAGRADPILQGRPEMVPPDGHVYHVRSLVGGSTKIGRVRGYVYHRSSFVRRACPR